MMNDNNNKQEMVPPGFGGKKPTADNTPAIPGILGSKQDLTPLSNSVQKVMDEISKVIVGQKKLVKLLLAAILADGHVLLEGFPGLAKTLTAKLTAKTIDTDFSRIQFTPDLMPSDVIGTSVFDMKKSDFEFKAGPIFSNIVLIDEINRAPAKTQAALFEVMQEKQITVDGNRMEMAKPFMIIATQNPIDMEGTYSLPEAQLDRFIFKIRVGYPSVDQEYEILQLHNTQHNVDGLGSINAVMSAEELIALKKVVSSIEVDSSLLKYMANIVHATRNHHDIYLGASPRASLALLQGSKAIAAINGRDYVIPEDIIEVAESVLAHRIILTPDKEMEGSTAEEVVSEVVKSVNIPR